MTDFVYIKGEAVQTGAHGDHDYLFQSGEPVLDAGRSDLVFESGQGLGGNLGPIDTFDDGDLVEYQDDEGLDRGGRDIVPVTSPVFGGSHALSASVNNTAIWSNSLENLPVRGDTFHFAVRIDQTDFGMEMGWAHTQPDNQSHGYQAGIDTLSTEYTLRFTDQSGPENGNFGHTAYLGISQGEWVIVEVEFGDPTITVRALDPATGDEYASLQQDDTQSDSGYVGWDTTNSQSSGQAYVDEAYLGPYTA